MKKLLVISVVLFLTVSVFAQTPLKLTYQAIIRNANNELIQNSSIGMRISILQGSESGTAVYTETHSVTTNANGLISVQIGAGTTTDDFSAIDWSGGPYFIKTEADPSGGTSYSITGVSPLLSVPYALYAKTAESSITETDPVFTGSVANGITESDITNWNSKLSSYTETDPVFDASVAKTIKASDTTYWNHKLDSYTEKQNLADVMAIKNSAGNKQIKDLVDPTDAQDAVTKAYVDKLLSIIQLIQTGLRDEDGNAYKVVLIGNQLWMAENLRTTKYNDGTPIPKIEDGTDWTTTEDGAYCWYKNDSLQNSVPYGALYNWQTIKTEMLCPTGWHVPTDKEIGILIDNLGGDEKLAGGKLKEEGTTHWYSPNEGATNESGFTAVPGGLRDPSDGEFYQYGELAVFWTSTEGTYPAYWVYILTTNNPSITLNDSNSFKSGFSVRCVKD